MPLGILNPFCRLPQGRAAPEQASTPAPSKARKAAPGQAHAGLVPVDGDMPADNSPAAQACRLIHAPGARGQHREQAARVLLVAYEPRMRGWALRWQWQAEDGEDLLQETVFRYLTDVPADCVCPAAFFHTVQRRIATDMHRRRQAQCRIPEGLLVAAGSADEVEAPVEKVQARAEGSDPVEVALRRQLIQMAHDAANAAAGRGAEVMLMFAEGLSNEEIAAALGCSTGAARDRVYRVRKHLRALFNHSVK